MSGATIREVAKSAGVSIATVSRVLNTPDKVRPATLERVRKAMGDVNYIQNTIARGLKKNQTKIIGFVVSDLCNGHFTYMAKEIEKYLRSENYSLILCNTDDNPELERLHIERLLALHVDGLIINTTCMNNDFIEEVSHLVPIVLVSRRIPQDFQGDYVGSNNAGGTELLTKYLLEIGHRRIGIITSDLKFSTGKERLDGFLSTMRSAGIEVDDSYLYRGNSFNEIGGAEGCQYLLSLPQKPTAIVIGNNSMALGAYKYLRAQNIDIPGELSVVSYGDIDNNELFWLSPTFVTLSSAYIGQKAASCLISRIRNQHSQNREIIYEPTLVIGQTTRSFYSKKTGVFH